MGVPESRCVVMLGAGVGGVRLGDIGNGKGLERGR